MFWISERLFFFSLMINMCKCACFLVEALFEAGIIWGQINPHVGGQGLCQDDLPWGQQKGHRVMEEFGLKAISFQNYCNEQLLSPR